jgi:hypothetical protein
MSYTKQVWNSGVSGGTPISASALNYMESGIEQAAGVSMTNAQRVGACDCWPDQSTMECTKPIPDSLSGGTALDSATKATASPWTSLAIRDGGTITAYDGLTVFVASTSQTDGGEWLYTTTPSAAWVKLNVPGPTFFTATNYASSLPLTGTPAAVPSANYNITTPRWTNRGCRILCPAMGNWGQF